MAAAGTAFRVLGKSDASLPASPAIVAYRVDPATLAYVGVSGDAERLLGYPAREWREPEFWVRHLHPEDAEAGRAFCREWSRALTDSELEYRMIGADGRTVWVHDIIEVRHEAGDAPEIRGAMTGITWCADGEADTGRAHRLKDELFRIVAEELAQPVRSIAGFAQMLERHLAAQHDDVGSDYALGLQDGMQRLDHLLARLMRVAQSEQMDFDDMLRELAAIRTRQADRH